MNQELLPYIAAALQWARAQKRFSEAWFLGIVVLASFGFYLLAHPTDAFRFPWNEVVALWWEQAKTILAATQLVSSGANVINAMRPNPKSPVPALLPVTNSQP